MMAAMGVKMTMVSCTTQQGNGAMVNVRARLPVPRHQSWAKLARHLFPATICHQGIGVGRRFRVGRMVMVEQTLLP